MLHTLRGTRPAAPLDAAIETRRPLLARILRERGTEDLLSFSRSNLRDLPRPSALRLKEFLGSVRTVLEPRIGGEKTAAVCRQLGTYFVACSADHHGPLNGSPLVNVVGSNVWLAAGIRSMSDPELSHIVVLSCAGVSQNVEDYPRGVLFSSLQVGTWCTRDIPILPSSRRMSVVYGHRAWTKEETSRAGKILESMERENLITAVERTVVSGLLREVYASPEALGSRDLLEQVTRVNRALWKRLWGEELPELVYLDMESLAAVLLAGHHLTQETPFHAMLFSEAGRRHLQSLEDAMAPSLRQGKQPTDLFWALSDGGRRVRLTLEGNVLIPGDGSPAIPLEPSAIADALASKKIFPSLFLSLSLLHLYYGLNCLGGAGQIQYLDAVSTAYRNTGLDPEAPSPRSDLYNFGPDFLFLDEECRFPAHALDILLHGGPNCFRTLESSLKEVTLAQAFAHSSHVISTILSVTEPS